MLAASSSEGDELLHHLLVDYLVKVGVVALLFVLAAGAMVVIWRRSR